jgi:chemotaxis protein methyltransferase CheR
MLQVLKITDDEFDRLWHFIYDNYGIDLHKKRHLVEGRLGLVVEKKGFSNFGDYFETIYSDSTGDELSQLLSRVTTNHTYFMREQAHFEFYRNKILPDLEQTVKNKSIGVWSAGCSSGEEPYTLAMLTDEVFRHKDGWDTRILATDLSDRVLSLARRGVYDKSSTDTLPEKLRKQYVVSAGDGVCTFIDRVKNNVIFKKFNLMDDFRFKRKFHVIFCRNVMIYFDLETKLRLVDKFYEFTEPGGYLFIGHSEYLDKEAIKYKCIAPAVYKKE